MPVVRFKQFPIRVMVTVGVIRVRVGVRVKVSRVSSVFIHKSSEASFDGTYQSCPLYCKVGGAHLYIHVSRP